MLQNIVKVSRKKKCLSWTKFLFSLRKPDTLIAGQRTKIQKEKKVKYILSGKCVTFPPKNKTTYAKLVGKGGRKNQSLVYTSSVLGKSLETKGRRKKK